MGTAKKNQCLLWEVCLPDKTFCGYVLGTMHTRDQRVHALLPLLEPYVTQCQVLATEFSIHETSGDTVSTLSPVEDWTPMLSRKQKNALEKLLHRFHLGTLDQYVNLPPLMLLQALVEELLGKEATQPFDLVLAVHGEAMGLSIGGVETLNEQLAILETIPLDVQKKQLVQVLANQSKYKRQVRNQVKWYLRQDIRQLYRVSRKQLGSLRKLLLLDRNRRMAKRISRMFENQPHFIAVGAAHLWGGKGILARLKKSGFRLVPVRIRLNE